jgi:gamma-glutamyltranspeptidase/glutathione hydrolase
MTWRPRWFTFPFSLYAIANRARSQIDTRTFLLWAVSIVIWPGNLHTEARVQPAMAPSAAASTGPAHFGVATQHPQATEAAVSILAKGGTAADAAIAAAFTLGVVAPDCSGLGGGGFALISNQGSRDVKVLDFRETAPSRLEPKSLERQIETPDPHRNGMLVGVPGEVRGLFELHRRYGRLPIAVDMEPAIHAAQTGYDVGAALARNAYAYRRQIDASPLLRTEFDPPAIGPVFAGFHVAPENALANTLQTIARNGADAFYRASIAADIVASVAAAGGWLSMDDMASYVVVDRQPLRVDWEGYEILTMPPPSAGGLLLVETLKSMSKSHLRSLGFGSTQYVHELAEVFRNALDDRMRQIGDPSFVMADLAALTDDDRMARRRSGIEPFATHALPSAPVDEHGTSHIVVVDGAGSVVSLTTTVGDAFGARVAGEHTGIVLNDELIDFSSARQFRPFRAAAQANRIRNLSPNSPRPEARPVSSMTPTIVFRDGAPVLAIGGAGGLRIATGVTQALLARLAFDQSPSQAIAAPRFHTPYEGATTELEFGTDKQIASGLRDRGEHVEWFANFSAVQMTVIEMRRGVLERVEAAADPRFGGRAEGR